MITFLVVLLLISNSTLCKCLIALPTKNYHTCRAYINYNRNQGRLHSNTDNAVVASDRSKKNRLKILAYLESLRPKGMEIAELIRKQSNVDTPNFEIQMRLFNASFDVFTTRYPDDCSDFGFIPSRKCLIDSYSEVLANELKLGKTFQKC